MFAKITTKYTRGAQLFRSKSVILLWQLDYDKDYARRAFGAARKSDSPRGSKRPSRSSTADGLLEPYHVPSCTRAGS